MEIYGIYLGALALFNVGLAYHRHQNDKAGREPESFALPAGDDKKAAAKFQWEYFGLYALVMVADWLQGPYMYTLYKDEKQIAESTVAALFTTGFVTAGITASFVGSLADQYGRKAACLTCCTTYGVSCLLVLSNDLFILFVGRALGGLSTTLLYSVFETWMIAEYHKRELSRSLSLDSMFGFSVTLSGIVAIVSGVIGEAIVETSGTKTAPFIAAFFTLAVAFVGISHFWAENHGDTTLEKSGTSTSLLEILSDRRIIALGLTTTLFEGLMYLFVFFWSPALISSRAIDDSSAPPPFGIIFSCFMCCMMLGSMIFSIANPNSVRDAGRLMLNILALASCALLIPVLQRAEATTFWSFALFEMCVGLYFPSMSRIKSEVVDEVSEPRYMAS